MSVDLVEQERSKYRAIWSIPQYSDHSPGERQLGDALRWMKPAQGATITDWGCGCGRASEKMAQHGYQMRLVDIARNCYPGSLSFVEACLWELPDDLAPTDHGYCCDVMEHIPPDKVEAVLAQISARTSMSCYLQIALFDDNFGKKIGQPLHLSVFKPLWWTERVNKAFR